MGWGRLSWETIRASIFKTRSRKKTELFRVEKKKKKEHKKKRSGRRKKKRQKKTKKDKKRERTEREREREREKERERTERERTERENRERERERERERKRERETCARRPSTQRQRRTMVLVQSHCQRHAASLRLYSVPMTLRPTGRRSTSFHLVTCGSSQMVESMNTLASECMGHEGDESMFMTRTV